MREKGDVERTGYLQIVSFVQNRGLDRYFLDKTLLKLQTWKPPVIEAAAITQTILKFS